MISSHFALPPRPEALGHDALRHHATHLGRDYRIDSVPGEPLLDGNFGVDVIEEELVLRHAAIRNRHRMSNHAEMMPGLKLILFMAGTVDVRFDGRPMPLASERPTALLVHLREAAMFERHALAGTHEFSLTLTLSPAWLQTSPETARLLDDLPHLGLRQWQPSAGLLTLARTQLSTPRAADDFSTRLRREGLALTMAGEGLAPLLRTSDRDSRETRQQRRLWDFIEGGSGDTKTLTEIAGHLNMSVSTLQRLSQQRYGMPLQRHLRQRRLDAANRALQDSHVSVSEAAELAGYNDATNFATAFRRTFGITPRQARERQR